MTFISADAQTNANLQGYGFSPTEAAKEHINYFMQTEQFNARFFSQGGMTRGILVVNTGTDANQSQYSLNALQRQWSSQLGGLNNAWRIPVAVAQD
ncbi:phage portal protein, partial [Staphylococcus aureus]